MSAHALPLLVYFSFFRLCTGIVLRLQTLLHLKTNTMTKHSLIVLLGAYFLLITLATSAQTPEPKVPRWVPTKGYWVIESNIHTPKQSTVFFYNNDGVMVYKEAVEGRRLKVENRSTRLHLAYVLQHSITAWEKNRPLAQDQQLMARRPND